MNVKQKSKFYKALGDPVRLRIIQYLLKDNKCICICDLAKLTKRDPSVIFRHVQQLKEAEILDTYKEKNCLMCCIKDDDKIKRYLED